MADGILNPVEQLEAEIDFDVYTKQEVDALLDEKADADSVYTKTETDTLLSAKADKSTTLAGYGITDAYTKTETNNLLNGKADADDVYTKTEIDTKIPNTVGSATKPVYVNGGVVSACTYELNKTVPANAVFTDTTYTAGNGLNLSGTSFSAKAGTNVTVDSSGINVNGNGVVTSADSGLINGGTAYTELRPTLDGTWVKNAQTTAINLQKLEGGIEYLYGLLSHQYDQLKKYINGNYYDYQTDTDTKYTKTVLNGAMPYASLEQIGGKTVVWNQLAPSSYSQSANAQVAFDEGTSIIAGHKYYIARTLSASVSISNYIYCRISGAAQPTLSLTGTSVSDIQTASYSGVSLGTTSATDGNTWIYQNNGGNTCTVTDLQITDLTLLYGAGNEPSTVAEFTSQFPAQYYPYNAGTLLSAGVTEVKSVGFNVWDEQWENGGYNGTTGVKVNGNYKLRNKNPIPVLPNTTYYFCGDNISYTSWISIYDYDIGGNFIRDYSISSTNCTFTTGSNAYYICWNTSDGWGNLVPYTGGICINVSNASYNGNYYPYNAHTYPIPASIQALTGYGWSAGTVFNYIDYERKVFVQNVARVDLGTLTWNKNNTYAQVFTASLTNCATGTAEKTMCVCQKYTAVDCNTVANFQNNDKAIMIGKSTTALYVADSDYYSSSGSDLKSALSGVYCYYELATPVEVDISAYLTDDNLINVEAGGTLTFPNSNGDDYRIEVPSSETYMVDLQSAI